MSNRYYVYALLDPANANLPFYVGKGSGYRRINHYCPSYLKRRSYKAHIIKAYRARGFEDKHVVLVDGLSEAEAFDLEGAYILLFGLRLCGGLLVNQSHGGEGCSGHSTPRTPEWRAKISAAHVGKVVSAETRERQRQAKLGKPLSAEHREKLSKANMGRPTSDTHRRNLSLALKGKKRQTEAQRRIALLNLRPSQGYWYDVTCPDGTAIRIRSLKKFCRDNGLMDTHLGAVALGKRSHHRGYRAAKVRT